MKKIILLIIILVGSILIVGCGNKEIDYEKHLINFSYDYGSNDEYYSYNISYDGDIVVYSTIGLVNMEKTIDKEYLDKLDKIIEKYNILDWDGFNKQKDNKDSNEIAFSIQIGYDNGKNYNASGYGKYPKRFEEAHEELLNILNQIKY